MRLSTPITRPADDYLEVALVALSLAVLLSIAWSLLYGFWLSPAVEQF
ncbi:hypothetical protein [Paraburkholderia sp. SIMBA_054]